MMTKSVIDHMSKFRVQLSYREIEILTGIGAQERRPLMRYNFQMAEELYNEYVMYERYMFNIPEAMNI